MSIICSNCGRDTECELCAPLCICCYSGKDTNPKRGKSCCFPNDCLSSKNVIGKAIEEKDKKVELEEEEKYSKKRCLKS